MTFVERDKYFNNSLNNLKKLLKYFMNKIKEKQKYIEKVKIDNIVKIFEEKVSLSVY